MTRRILSVLAMSTLMIPGIPLLAHHSFAAEYDSNKPVSLSGTVTKVEWANPHVRFYIDVTKGGTATNWEFELGSPNGLMRKGWTRNSLKPGDKITVDGYLAKDGATMNGKATTESIEPTTLFVMARKSGRAMTMAMECERCMSTLSKACGRQPATFCVRFAACTRSG